MFKKPISKERMELIRYLFFGALSTIVNVVVYAVLVQFVGLNIAVGNAIALVVTVVFAFVTNKLWVFESKSWALKQVVRESLIYIGARTFTGIIDLVGVPLLFVIGVTYPLFGIEGFLAKAIITVIVNVLNYLFSKFVIFRRSRGSEESGESESDESE